jgi:hypothetical protein
MTGEEARLAMTLMQRCLARLAGGQSPDPRQALMGVS